MQLNHALDRFVTSSYYRRDRWPDRLFQYLPKLDRSLSKRWQPGLDSRLVYRYPSFEMPEIWHRRRGNKQRASDAVLARDSNFDSLVANKFVPKATAFWGFQGSCLESLTAASAKGIPAICELATAHVLAAERILDHEAQLHCEWSNTISNYRFPDWYRERLEKEPHYATHCVVASQFTHQSLTEIGIPDSKILKLPLGCDTSNFEFRSRSQERKLKVLFVGGIGQRKGIKYLLEAIKKLSNTNVELHLLGPLPADTKPLEEYRNHYQYLGQTDQQGVAAWMQQADLMVLPSVFEGFGLVVIEAMATGLPVIASTHSCGPDVITDGVDGFVIQHDDVDKIATHIDWAASHREELLDMGRRACQTAKEYSWDKHAERLGMILKQIETTHTR